MATTSPDNLYSPDSSDPYALTQDLGAMQDSVQSALVRRANAYVGTSAQRNAFTTAPVGTIWSDTNGSRLVYKRGASSWEPVSNIISDTGWVDCTLASGVQQQGSLTPQVRRIGNVVRLRWGVSSSGFPASDAKDAITIPSGFRPPQPCYFSVASSSSGVSARAWVNTNGVVQIRTQSTMGSNFMFDGISYLTN